MLKQNDAQKSCETLIFLESAGQVHAAAALQGQVPSLETVAVFPLVMEQAHAAKLRVHPLDDFGNTASLERLCPVVIERLEELTCIFDSQWATLTADIPSARCVSFRCFFHTLKGFWDSLLKRGLPVLRALDALRPSQVLAFSELYAVTGFNLLDKAPTGLTTALVPQCAAHKDIPLRLLSTGVHDQNILYYPPAPPAVVPLATAVALLHKAQHSPAWAPEKKERRKTLFMYMNTLQGLNAECGQRWLQAGHTVAPLIPAVQGYGLPLDMLHQCCQTLAHAAADAFRQDERVRELLVVEGFDAGPLFAPYIDALLRCKLKDLLALSHTAVPYFQGFPQGVVLGGGMTNEAFVVTRAARQQGIPTLNQHKGGMLGYAAMPMFERYDLSEAQYFLVNGRESTKNYAQPCANVPWPASYPRAKTLVVGAQWVWDILKKERPQRSMRPQCVCYLPEADIGDNGYLGHLIRPSFSMFETAKGIVDTFCRHPHMELHIKPYPPAQINQVGDALLAYVERIAAPNIKVLPQCTVSDVVHHYDVFLLDYPGTPLTEVAATTATVLLYVDKNTYAMHNNAAAILQECAHYFSELQPFLCCLEDFCAHPASLPAKSMQDFLANFCLTSLQRSPGEILFRVLEAQLQQKQ